MLTAVAFLLLGLGVILIYAGITKQSVTAELSKALGR